VTSLNLHENPTRYFYLLRCFYMVETWIHFYAVTAHSVVCCSNTMGNDSTSMHTDFLWITKRKKFHYVLSIYSALLRIHSSLCIQCAPLFPTGSPPSVSGWVGQWIKVPHYVGHKWAFCLSQTKGTQPLKAGELHLDGMHLRKCPGDWTFQQLLPRTLELLWFLLPSLGLVIQTLFLKPACPSNIFFP
jgi:hypothetical protein